MSLFTKISAVLRGGRGTQHLTAEDFAQMRITGTVEYLAGAFTLTAIALIPNIDDGNHTHYLILAGVGVLLGALRYTVPQELLFVRLSILAGFLYVATIVSVSRPVGPTPLFFLWPVLTCAYFLGRRDLIVAFACFFAALAGALTVSPGSDYDLQMFLPTQGVIVIVSCLVLAMRERVDGLMGELEYTASTDVLTALPNRRTFTLAFDRELERARRLRAPLALAVFDLDHFKAINDELGHAEGDRALQRFADVLRTECRVVDVAARIGGEEFALLLTNATAEGARSFSERLIQRLALVTRHDPAPLSVSVGVTELTGPGDTEDVLLLAADRALYEAKRTGRGRVVVARPAPAVRLEQTGQPLELSGHGAPDVASQGA